MVRNVLFRLLTVLLIVFGSGCRHRLCQDCCQIDTTVADAKIVLGCTGSHGKVSSTFGGLGDFDSSPVVSFDQFNSCQTIALELEHCCCVAATNSPIADVIDKERKAVCCTAGFNECVDRFLAGQALQQRNKAAAIAGELFLRLVELQLQQQLIQESFSRQDELQNASRIAADEGFATADAENELDKLAISLNKQLVDLQTSHLKLVTKLNSILGIDGCDLKIIEPIFDLAPVLEEVDIDSEVETALGGRPDLAAFSGNSCGCMDPDCFSILSQIDPRVGIRGPQKLKLILLLQRLLNRPDPTAGIRTQQMTRLKNAREELIRLEVTDAVLAIQTGYRKLTLENDNLRRLVKLGESIEAAAELDAGKAYIESVKNWAQQQEIKSSRISLAIEYEVAKIKLLEVTGQWNAICGLRKVETTSRCGCTCKEGKTTQLMR